MRRVRLLGTLFIIFILIPTSPVIGGGSKQVYPGCGDTLRACINATPAGGKLVLKTNLLLTMPKSLTFEKGITIKAGDGFKPKIGRKSGFGYLEFDVKDFSAQLAIRGIRFKGVVVRALFSRGKHNNFQFIDNTIEANTHSNGDSSLLVAFQEPSRGSAVVRNNHLSSSGSGIEMYMRGGSASVTGNTMTSPVFEDGSSGIAGYFAGQHSATATIASNVIHDKAGCYCGSSDGIHLAAFDSASVKASIMNNTIDQLGEAPNMSVGIDIRMDDDDPNAEMNLGIFNNIVTNTQRGLQILQDPQLTVTGDSNNTYQNLYADITGSYDMGLTLHQDPLYLDAPNNDFRLQSNSSMGGGGTTCVPGRPLPRSDASNKFRLHASQVDIGAYELGSQMPGTVPGRNISGTENADVIQGTDGVDVLCGLDENDELSGGKGRDFILGGINHDTLRGKAGPDYVFGDEGADQLFGGSGPDFLNSFDGQGTDIADGQAGDDTCPFDTGDVLISCEH